MPTKKTHLAVLQGAALQMGKQAKSQCNELILRWENRMIGRVNDWKSNILIDG